MGGNFAGGVQFKRGDIGKMLILALCCALSRKNSVVCTSRYSWLPLPLDDSSM